MIWFLTLVVVAIAFALWFAYRSVAMPGKSFRSELPPMTDSHSALASQLQHDVEHLAGTIGERNLSRRPEHLEKSALWIESRLQESGWPHVERHPYDVQGKPVRNLIVESAGTSSPAEIVIVGAHYDSAPGTPGANDNGSAVASLLALAAQFAPNAVTTSSRTLRLVFFVNEEPPWFQQEEMGSLQYARLCRQRGDNIIGMLSLETMGYYSSTPGSQQYPLPALKSVYPDTGNFIAFVGATESKDFILRTVDSFRKNTKFPSEGTAIPKSIPGVGWSDHWSFQIHGYPSLMVTDTAPFRYPHYHTADDTPDKIDYQSLARVTTGLVKVVEELLSEQ